MTKMDYLKKERSERKRRENKLLADWLKKNKIKTKLEDLSLWDRANLLDRLAGL